MRQLFIFIFIGCILALTFAGPWIQENREKRFLFGLFGNSHSHSHEHHHHDYHDHGHYHDDDHHHHDYHDDHHGDHYHGHYGSSDEHYHHHHHFLAKRNGIPDFNLEKHPIIKRANMWPYVN